jgi:ribonuclease R
MSEELQKKIVEHLQSGQYRPQRARGVARELQLHEEESYHAFRDALKELMRQGRVVAGARGALVLPAQREAKRGISGTYRHNRRGFGFVVPSDPSTHEDLYIPQGENGGAISGDIVQAVITSTGHRDGKAIYTGRVTEILQRTQKQFVGTLQKIAGEWFVLPDGNTLTEPIRTPDAASKHIKVGTKVVVDLTTYPEDGQRPEGVISEVLGQAGEKDVDLKSIIIQYNLPGDFPDEVKEAAREAVANFRPEQEKANRLDITDQLICTIDPDDAKDYDDAISLRQLDNGYWELGVHIADVSHFVPAGSVLDVEARKRGNSCYFPGFVIPMLPEVLSNGVCSLQEGVPRLCKSAFITYDDDANPVSAKFASTVIKSAKRLRYREAQAILDNAQEIPHPDGPRRVSDYDPAVVELLRNMDTLAKRLQKRRQKQGQLVLDLPQVDLVLDEEGKVIDAVPEDQSFTHTLIEMFMVEANEAVARLLDSLGVPFLRRTHPEPELIDAERIRTFVQVAGYKLPKNLDRKALQSLLAAVRGKPEAFAINLAVLKSLTRAEYSPEPIGHYALASEHYCHFTSPIRRYADLTIHRLLDEYLEKRDARGGRGGRKAKKIELENAPSFKDLVELGKHISFTERQAEAAERELRQVKVLELLKHHIGEVFDGVVTGITNFGIFVQLKMYLIEGLIRYEHLMDDWWDVDEKAGVVRGQRTGMKIAIGDVAKVVIANVDVPRRELNVGIRELRGRSGGNIETLTGKKASRGRNGGKGKSARGTRHESGHHRGKGRGAANGHAKRGKGRRR